MSDLSVCTAEYLISDSRGLRLAEPWLPRVVGERFAASTRDGAVDRAPDQIPFIETDLIWTNRSSSDQHVMVSVHRASRSLVSSNTNTVALDDVWSHAVGVSPTAARPTGTRSGLGTRVSVTRPSVPQVQFARIFADRDDWVSYEEIGKVPAGETVHFRYMCLFSTPGPWRTPPQPRHEAYARWVRLRMWASPYLTGV